MLLSRAIVRDGDRRMEGYVWREGHTETSRGSLVLQHDLHHTKHRLILYVTVSQFEAR